MGFRDDRRAILEALEAGNYAHEMRGIPNRNQLHEGTLSVSFVAEAIQATRGTQARAGTHHQLPKVTVWIMKPTYKGKSWYIKCYLHDGIARFISVHPAER